MTRMLRRSDRVKWGSVNETESLAVEAITVIFTGDKVETYYCKCGRERCKKYNHIDFRLGVAYRGDEVIRDILHIDVHDYYPDGNKPELSDPNMEWSELMLDKEQAEDLAKYLAAYYLFPYKQLDLIGGFFLHHLTKLGWFLEDVKNWILRRK